MAQHTTRIDTHRILLTDESAADEGGHPPGYGWRENQGRHIEPVPAPLKAETSASARVAGVLLAVSIGLVGALALVAWWTTP